MQRRVFLKWAINGLGAVVGTVLGVPAVAYLIDALNRPERPTTWRNVAHFDDLPFEIPTEFVIRDTRRDAWNLHPDDIIGRVWLIRHEATPDKVTAFNSTCPHLGCSINWNLYTSEFLCPCHGGRFLVDGKRVLNGGNNPAPRDMDTLKCQVEADPETPGVKIVQVQFERFKTNQSAKEPENKSDGTDSA
jgi:menaquinol-cytochrome c reductase iron-sulfur subunit